MTDIQQNITSIRTHIPKDVTLVCVSKFQPSEAIMQAYEASERDFGESRVQELLPKYEDLPKDIVDPLYDFGYGIDVQAFGK